MHVTQRGAHRARIFRVRADYECFLACLRTASERHGVAVHGYGLMDNHLHIMATPNDAASLARTMQQVGRWYVPYFNSRYQLTGTLFQGRYAAKPVPTERWMTCLRYVEHNPVEARMVDSPEAHPWTSYRAHAFGGDPHWLTLHAVYLGLADTAAARQARYRALCASDLDSHELEQLRSELHHRWPKLSRRVEEV